MALIFTIDAIDGNSHIGVPVFSRSAKKSNFNYLVFTSPKNNDNVHSTLGIFDQVETDSSAKLEQLKFKEQVSKLAVLLFQSATQKRLKDLEIQRKQLVQAQERQQKMMEEGESFQNQNSTGGPNQKDGDDEMAKLRAKGNKTTTNASFSSMTREQYYKVHGLKTEQPKLGNIYKPRFEYVEKRIIGPIYVGDKKHPVSKEAIKADIIKRRKYNQSCHSVCDKIMKVLGSNVVKSNTPMRNTKIGEISLNQILPPSTLGHINDLDINLTNNIQNVFQTAKKERKLTNADLSEVSPGAIESTGKSAHVDSQNNMSYMSKQEIINTSPIKKSQQHRFMMNHTPISQNTTLNTDKKDKTSYYLVNKYPELSVIKDDTKLPDQVLPKVLTREFQSIIKRRDFVSSRDPPHEKRFDPVDSVIYNPQTTKKNVPLLSLDRQNNRNPTLILKGGDHLLDISQKNASIFYNANKEAVLQKTTLKVLSLDKYNKRDYHGSIYRREFSPDYYDSNKVTSGFKQQSGFQSPKAMVEMEKQTARDFSKLYASSGGEAFKNILRDNARQLWIKKLVEGTD